MERSSETGLRLRHAVCLGLAHGPAELLPISSSAHTTLIPWLAGWDFSELAPELRKDLEVALHAGTAAALLLGARRELLGAAWLREPRAALVLALALAPPALAGALLERRIERLGTPGLIAGGLAAGALALGAADRWGPRGRAAADAGPLDGLLLGFAQAAALVPGISRNGATLTACRARGFDRGAADELSRECGLAIILGAAALRAWRSRVGGATAARARSGPPLAARARSGPPLAARARSGPPLAARGRLVAGGIASFASTLAARRLLERRDRPVSLAACAAYRTLLAGVVVVRLGRAREST
jgi:undecaprenyl-diphosphatase